MTGRTEVHICQGNVTGLYYRDQVIEPSVVPYAHRHGNAFISQDDNARSHRARFVQGHLQFGRITTLPWLVRPPDLSPIEHLWDVLGRRVQRRLQKPQDTSELADAVQEEWRRIPRATTGRLIMRMRRLAGVPGGEWIPYSLCKLLCEIPKLALTELDSKSNSNHMIRVKLCCDKCVVDVSF